jgi:hypothetical protein
MIKQGLIAPVVEDIIAKDIDRFLYDPRTIKEYTFIYFIVTNIPTDDKSLNRVKIGIAIDVDSRLKGLQTGCPFELLLRYKIKVPKGMERNLEKSLHEKFDRYRVQGEWFVLDQNIIDWLDFHANQFNLKYKLNRKPCYKLRKNARIINKDKPDYKFSNKELRFNKKTDIYEFSESWSDWYSRLSDKEKRDFDKELEYDIAFTARFCK